MLCGQSCPRLPSAAVQALRQRLSTPLMLDQVALYRPAFGTCQTALDWRAPLLRPDVTTAAVPQAAEEAVAAQPEAESQDSASRPTFSSLGLDRRVTVSLHSCGLADLCLLSCTFLHCAFATAGRLGTARLSLAVRGPSCCHPYHPTGKECGRAVIYRVRQGAVQLQAATFRTLLLWACKSLSPAAAQAHLHHICVLTEVCCRPLRTCCLSCTSQSSVLEPSLPRCANIQTSRSHHVWLPL